MDPFIGEIRPFPYNYAPVGWLYCDGRLLDISEYEALYYLIGTIYGGDGEYNFALPDLRSRVPMGQNSASPLGEMGGAESVALTSQQIPSHTHALTVSSSGTSSTPVSRRPGLSSSSVYGDPTETLAADSVAPSSGVGQPHENVQPYLTIAYCICYQGIFPSQN